MAIGDFQRQIDAIHAAHDCAPGPCQCACGCSDKITCRAILGALCTQCHMNWVRGRDGEDGKPDCEPLAVY